MHPLTRLAVLALAAAVRLSADTDDRAHLEAILDGTAGADDLADDLMTADLRHDVLDRPPLAREGGSVGPADAAVHDLDCVPASAAVERDDRELTIDIVLVPLLGLELLEVKLALAGIDVEARPSLEFVVGHDGV